MIAMASNMIANGLHLSAVCEPHMREKKSLNTKAMITYKRPATVGQKLTNYKHLALSKSKVRQDQQPLCTCGCHEKHNKSMVPFSSQIMKKYKTFPLNQNLTCANWYL